MFGDGDDDVSSYREEYPPFALKRLVRHPFPIEPGNFGLALDGSGASTDEWVDLGLGFNTFEEAWAAGVVLLHLLPKERAPWIRPGEFDPLISIIELRDRYRKGDGQVRMVNLYEFKPLVASLVAALLSAKKIVDDTNASCRDTDLPF